MIPLAIAIGIIEDKIANDLTSKDTKARECLEDVKAKISRHKPKQYKTTNNGQKTYRNKDNIEWLTVWDADTEEEYIEGTTRGLVDL